MSMTEKIKLNGQMSHKMTFVSVAHILWCYMKPISSLQARTMTHDFCTVVTDRLLVELQWDIPNTPNDDPNQLLRFS